MWDDLAHGKGVYVAEHGLVRFVYLVLTDTRNQFELNFKSYFRFFHKDSQKSFVWLIGMKVNGFKTTWKAMGLLKLIYPI